MYKRLIVIVLLLFLVGCSQPDVVKDEPPEESEVKEVAPIVIPEKEDCPYECCLGEKNKKKLCAYDSYCEENTCIKFECLHDEDCPSDKQCSDNFECINFSCGLCEYKDENQCLKYECCNNEDCSEGNSCVENICEPSCGDYRISKNGYCVLSPSIVDEGNKDKKIISCDAELIDADPLIEEIKHYHFRVEDNCDSSITGVFKEKYKEGNFYYTIKLYDTSTNKIITTTTIGENLKELVEGSISEDEFLSKSEQYEHKFIPTPKRPGMVNWEIPK